MTDPFSVDQREALTEIANIAMGKASLALATLLDRFVHLSVPEINVVRPEEVEGFLANQLDDCCSDLALVRQSFYGGLYGEVITLHQGGTADDLVELLGYEGEVDEAKRREFLLDIGNILSGAVLNGIGEILKIELGFSSPSLIDGEGSAAQTIVPRADIAWTHALLSQVHFRLETRRFSSRLLIFLPDRSFCSVRNALDRFLDEL